MSRILMLAIVVLLILFKLHRINKRVTCAKAYIFIEEIKNKANLTEANYKANLFDFFKKKEAKSVFSDMKSSLQKDYNNDTNKMIIRAEKWGFINTHSKAMFRKRENVRKILENSLLSQKPDIFSGNAMILSKDLIIKYWDINAFDLYKLDRRVCALKILLCQQKETKESYLTVVAAQIANDLKNDIKFLDEDDLKIISEWNKIIKNKK